MAAIAEPAKSLCRKVMVSPLASVMVTVMGAEVAVLPRLSVTLAVRL